MQFAKQATSVEEQISLLEKRGLLIDDDELADRWLRTVGYYRLSGYWLPFETEPDPGQTRSKLFRDGTTLSQIIEIYIFDRELRSLFMEAIERIEVAVRACWTNRLSHKFGAHAHLQPHLFASESDHLSRLTRLAKRVEESNETFIRHYLNTYSSPQSPPLWAVTELFSFGELSKLVSSTRDREIRAKVAADLEFPNRETLTGTLQHLAYVRNICAHHSRLWNRRFVKRLPNIKRLRDRLDVSIDGEQRQVENTVFNTLVILCSLLRHQAADTTYPLRTTKLLSERSNEQLAMMGCPENWRERLS
ncbi:MAG: Abi family protein [Ahrensia sp.]|nr:Abi family protein [Ahrensia sp.]